MERVIARTKAIKAGHPLDPETMIGAQASNEQYEKITSYLKIGKEEGAEVLTGGDISQLGGDLQDGFYIQPTIFKGNNKMRVFQEEIFGPVVSVTTFKTEEEAIEIANDTIYGLGAGVFTRDAHQAYQVFFLLLPIFLPFLFLFFLRSHVLSKLGVSGLTFTMLTPLMLHLVATSNLVLVVRLTR